MEKTAKIYVAGHHGLVGSAIWNNLQQKGYTNLVGRSHKELDLLDGQAVKKFFDEEQPQYVILAAAHVGGIMANSLYRADFIYQNLQIQQNVIGESFRHDVKKLLFLGSTCIYPRDAGQPMKEEVLLTSPLEYTNEPYAIAKIAGLKMCESFNLQYGTNYIAVMPTNLYGPNDNFHLENSHVLPAMIRKIHLGKCLNEGDWDAVRKDMNLRPVEGIDGSHTDEEILSILKKYGITGQEVTLWGTGKPLREFLWSEEMADASVYIMEHVDFKELVEPLRLLFKDEVRKAGLELGIPEYLVFRQPFPGPGLGVRIIGEVTADKVRIVQDADAIYREEIAKAGVDKNLGQYFAALTNMRSVGCMGDERTYDYAVALRAVLTSDFMTAESAQIPWEVLGKVTSRIVNEVKGVNRVLYDCTGKPPATIEFE